MSQARGFINPQTQSYASLKASIAMSVTQSNRFDVLNGHIVDSIVYPGEVVIVSEAGGFTCTNIEAELMILANDVHEKLIRDGAGVDAFLLENYEWIQSVLGKSAMGVGVVSDGWSRNLEQISHTLQAIDRLHQEHLVGGQITHREKFYEKRLRLFSELDSRIGSVISAGAGLRKESSVKRMLGISTKRYLASGQIRDYAEKLDVVKKAANSVKLGGYIGVALEVSSTAIDIRQACLQGREDACRRAKYVQGGKLIGGLSGGAAGGAAAGGLGAAACVTLGMSTAGTGALACAVISGAAGGWMLGSLGEKVGEFSGEIIYEQVQDE